MPLRIGDIHFAILQSAARAKHACVQIETMSVHESELHPTLTPANCHDDLLAFLHARLSRADMQACVVS